MPYLHTNNTFDLHAHRRRSHRRNRLGLNRSFRSLRPLRCNYERYGQPCRTYNILDLLRRRIRRRAHQSLRRRHHRQSWDSHGRCGQLIRQPCQNRVIIQWLKLAQLSYMRETGERPQPDEVWGVEALTFAATVARFLFLGLGALAAHMPLLAAVVASRGSAL